MGAETFKEEKSGLDYLKVINNGSKAVILFHGYGASMYDLHGLADFIDDKKEYDWYFPNGHLGLNMGMMMSRAWFPINMQELELAMRTGEHRDFSGKYPGDFEKAIELANQFLSSLADKYEEVILGGFSQGAMLATHLSLKNLGKIKRLICYSGTLIGKNKLMELFDNEHKLKFFQSHGKVDPVLGYDHAKNLFELLKLDGHQGEFVSFNGAHEIPMEVIEKTKKFLE